MRILGLRVPEACHAPEAGVPLDAAAQQLNALLREPGRGDLIITLGPRGCLAGERATSRVWWIGLGSPNPTLAERLRARSEHINGIGDRFFAAAALAFLRRQASPGRVMHAAREASARVLADAAGLPVAADSFTVRPLAGPQPVVVSAVSPTSPKADTAQPPSGLGSMMAFAWRFARRAAL